MQIPPEITFRNVEKTEALQNLVLEKIAKLERLCDHISHCAVAIERMHEHSSTPYRVRVDLTVPPGHELVANSTGNNDKAAYKLDTVIRDAFRTAERQLKELKDRQVEFSQSRDVEAADTAALVVRLFPENGYGFLRTLDDGEEIYFHRNSVVHDDFERIEVGTGVRYVAVMGENGLQASTVQIVNKPGAQVGKSSGSAEPLIEPPLGWGPGA